MEKLSRVVLITGGTKGIGLALATQVKSMGCNVISTTRDLSNFPNYKAAQNTVFQLDVTNEQSVASVFTEIEKRYGRLDVLINNAGVGVFKRISETSLNDWNSVISTNLTGAFLCSREAFRLMEKQGGGRIINIGSIADYIPLPENSAYGASKYGLRGLSAILNEEGKALNIRTTHVSLGAVKTEIWSQRSGFSTDEMLAPEDVATAIANIVTLPLSLRLDEIKLLPSKGVL